MAFIRFNSLSIKPPNEMKTCLILFVVLIAMVVRIEAVNTHFYRDSRKNGASGGENRFVDVRGCHNFNDFDNVITAVNTYNGCIDCYADFWCRGDSKRLEPNVKGCNHEDLSSCKFNDVISSCKAC